MFIWGDETEYFLRTKKNGFSIGTIVKSVHYHPKAKGKTVNIIPFISRYKVLIKPKNFSGIYYRNLGYIFHTHYGIFSRLLLFIKYTGYFLSRLKLGAYQKFITAYINGSRNKF
jgi:rhamnopyranosyl-N-acetylglucosaminyl-diphospho-decaprenol beta-1,3/1,4-galactofuranosyltransferase